jgi:hypothetical protein
LYLKASVIGIPKQDIMLIDFIPLSKPTEAPVYIVQVSVEARLITTRKLLTISTIFSFHLTSLMLFHLARDSLKLLTTSVFF